MYKENNQRGRYMKLIVALISLLMLVALLVACDSGTVTPTASPPSSVAADTPAFAQAAPTIVSEANPTPAATSESSAPSGTAAAGQPTASGVGTSDAAAALAQGTEAYNKANYDGAIAAFTHAVQASPQFGTAYLDRAISYFAKGDDKSALADLEQANGLQPQDPYPIWAYGLIYYKEGKFDIAQKLFSLLIKASPSDPTGYYWRAYTYIALKDPNSAVEDFAQAAKFGSDSDMGKQAKSAVDQLSSGQEIATAQLPQLAMAQGNPPLPPAPAEAVGKGQIVSDLGFRPQTDGFQFQNYGAQPDRTNMTPDDMRRMFGDQVCSSTANGCILTPEAQAWMERANKGAGGGHCEGFAALSLAMFQHKEDPSQFGAPKTHDLNIDGNTALQRELAFFWATQMTRPAVDNRIEDKTPSQILDILIDAFKSGPSAPKTYAMEFFKPGYKEGHAVTPYAVEDRGSGLFAVRIYDTNIPDAERILLIDRNANSWSYEASINPGVAASQYKGDASTMTLFITPTDPRLQKQVCNFCPGGGTSKGVGGLAAPEVEYNEVSLDGDAHLLITDKQGRRTGYVTDSQFVNEIAGVEIEPVVSANLWEDSPEPIYFIPTGVEFNVAVQSTNPNTNTLSTVTMIGPGYDLSVEDIVLEPNTRDTINFSPDGKTLVYKTDYSESPNIVLGTNGKDADFAFELRGVDIGSGGTVTTHLDLDKGQLVLEAKNSTEKGTYNLVMNRIDDKGEQTFGHDNIELQPGDTASLNYEQWKGNGTPLTLEIDHGSDGSIDETLTLSDVR